jgi:hypothetical protein
MLGDQKIVRDVVGDEGWTSIVRMNIDNNRADDLTGRDALLFYNATTGRAAYVVTTSDKADQTIVRDVVGDKGWTSIVPMNIDTDLGGRTDLLFYNAATGRAAYAVTTSSKADQTIVRDVPGDKGWTSIVPMTIDTDVKADTDLLFYNAASGRAVYSIDTEPGVKELMKGAGEKLGGPKSFLGLPLGNQVEISKAKGQYQSHFRSGTLNIATIGGPPTVNTKDVVNVTLLGIECQIKQEVSDEVYGVVSVFGPSGGSLSTRRFPDSKTLSMGPPGLRIVNLDLPILVQGVVQNYTILATMVENDSGDVDVTAQKISDKIASTVASGIGALTGAPAESVADSESFKEGLVTGVKFLFGDILGVGDDPFNPDSLGLRWEDLQPSSLLPIQPPLQRNDDPRTITGWTHSITLSGRDDGNDLGQYALYFRVDSETISVTPNH